MWPGVEPSPGVYNTTYLQVMRELVDDLYQAGIYTIVDFHQDVIAEQWCGEGIPAWMVPMLHPIQTDCNGIVGGIGHLIGQCTPFSSFNFTHDPQTGFPLTKDCLTRDFSSYYQTPDVASAWQNFYHFPNITDRFVSFWNVTASAFRGAAGVLGYDLLNEPLGGDFYHDASLLEPGVADLRVLQPLYQRLYKTIAAVDPEAVMMYEPTPFPDTYPANIPGIGGVHETGFTQGPTQGKPEAEALSFHIYSCGFADEECSEDGDPHAVKCDKCDQWVEDAFKSRTNQVANQLGGGTFLTEFGACSGSESCLAEIDRVTAGADRSFTSWAYWQFKYFHDITTVSGPAESFYNADGTLQDAKIKALTRTYAPVIAGAPGSMRFDIVTGAFRLTYAPDAATHGLKTEIYFNNATHYGPGYQMSCLNGTAGEAGPNTIEVSAGSGSITNTVDFALTRHNNTLHNATGVFNNMGWTAVNEETKPGFDFSTVPTLNWWKQLRIYNDNKELVCTLTVNGGDHGPHGCDLAPEDLHAFMFDYYIEVWEAKTFAHIHEHITTIPSSFFGPLVKKRVSFEWQRDGKGWRL